jgi:hypothetical protein
MPRRAGVLPDEASDRAHTDGVTDCEADLETALRLCAGCPVLSQCRQWVASLEWWQRPTGIVAGTLVTPKRGSLPTGRPRGRRPKRRVPA